MESVFQKINCAQCRLANACLADGLSVEETTQFESIIKRKRPIAQDQFLFRQEDKTNSLYIVKSGSFRSFIWDIDGGEQTIGFYLPGELLGLDALQNNGKHHCSVIALETATVCELPVPELNELCATIPKLRNQFMHMIGSRIVSDQNNLVLLGNRSATEKVATFLLEISQRYNDLGYSAREFNLTMPRHNIANYLGLSLETVSRQLGYLTKHGAISIKHRGVQISNRRFLVNIVEPCSSSRMKHAN